MLTRLLIRYLLGYVELSANGGNIEGFLSELFNEGVAAFGIIKRKRVTRLCVLARSYKIVARTAKKHGCRVRISSKRGAVFFFLRLKQKNSLLCGFLAFALTFFLLGQTVFSLEISGDSAVSKGEITSALARYGLSVGVWQRMVDIDYIKQNVMLDIDELAWMTINLSFGRAEVVFHDKTDEINKNEIKNIRIVALRDGQIKRVDVESGLALVSAGDVISKGQTLVEEAPFHIESSWTGGVKAQVLAYTSYTAEFCVDRRYSYRCLTDRKLILKRLRLYNAEIPLGVKKNGFFDYELFEYAVPFELL